VEAFARACLAVKNREKLRVGARSISGLADTMATFAELTTIAECLVKAAYERAVSRTGGAPRGAKSPEAFTVIAAGRLGAGMMDFGSDLDLVFVYRGADDPATGARTTERSVRLAQAILALLTGGGGVHKVYDVDARLRPEGGSSLLAVSLEEYRRYLETRAAEWERLAMTRARPVAGSEPLGAEAGSIISGFAYGRKFTGEEVERIVQIRGKMVEQSQKRYPGLVNVKSGSGGLADLDFVAQAFSAHYGAARPALRLRRTDAVLAELGEERIIERTEAAALEEAYRFLCDTERALRIGSGKSVNTLPDSGIELARVARLLGFANIRKFRRRLDDVLSLSRERYERLMRELRRDAGALS
jgi:glutamate-ammonia-ligase adenylyltransferase